MNESGRTPPLAPLSPTAWRKPTAVFLSSQSLSLFGSMLVQYAIIWHITLTTQSGAMLMVATLAASLPQILISVFAGVWADRYPRKLLIIGADLLTALSTLALAGFFLLGYRELWLIFLVSAIRSVGAGIQGPAVNAILPQIVPSEKLMRVNSLNGTIQPIVMITTPVLSGALLAFATLESIFFIDVVTALLAVSLLWALKVAPLPQAAANPSGGYFADLRAGVIYIHHNRTIRTLLFFFALTFFLVVPVAFLSPLLVTRSYGDEVWRLTANEVTFFGGSILGGVIMTLWGGFKNRFRTLGLACVVWALLFAALGLTRDFNVYLFFMVLAGLPMPFWSATATTLLQELIAPEMQGRVFGVQGLLVNAMMPLGMLIFGPLADVISIETLLVASSALLAVPGVWIWFHRQPRPSLPLPAALELTQPRRASQPGD